ncbi:hypothetical protein [Dietzia lutea]|nr:hypothetical protein [Dietzia lutea]
MSERLMIRDREASPDERRAELARPDDELAGASSSVAGAGDESGSAGDSANGSGHATVFPAPLTTIAAALVGGFLGLAAVYGVAERLADTLAGVAAVVMIFAVTLAGPRVHAGARTEVGRTVAVVLQSVGFGGVLGALLILT